MLREWSDARPGKEADEIWRRQMQEELLRHFATIEAALHDDVSTSIAPRGFYEAMKHFITLRETLFPNLPADPVWNILITLASTPEGRSNASVTSIAYGAGVPLTTALRYIAAMEIEGVVKRTPDPDDHRRVIIELTSDGRRRLDVIAERWKSRVLTALIAVPIAALVWMYGIAGMAAGI